jgi:hypothetical protein
VDPCESLPIFGIITSHFHQGKRKKKREGRREKELREREYLVSTPAENPT